MSTDTGRFGVMVVVLGSLALACSSGGKPGTSQGSAGNAGGTGGSSGGASGSGGAGGGGCTGPVTSVPDQWSRPADCSGIGNLCSEGCTGSACQLEGNVCIPFSRVGGSRSSCTPYCAAYACMTYDEASCFCTGSAAAQNPACACGPAALAGLCAAEGGSCAGTPCCNCMGLTCVTDSVSGTVCRQHCQADADCATHCCNKTAGVCQDALYCNCVGVAAGCDSNGPTCCPGNTCLTFKADGSGPFSCYQDCKTQNDCPTGTCCSQAITGLDHGACGPCQ